MAETFNSLDHLLVDILDLKGVCVLGLEFILGAIDRPGGLLLVQSPSDRQPYCRIESGLPPGWSDQLNDLSSALYQVAGEILHMPAPLSAGLFPVPSTLQGLAAALPLVAGAQPQGVLLLVGEPLSAQAMAGLRRISASLGRAISSCRANQQPEDFQPEFAALHSSLENSGFSGDPDILQKQLLDGIRRVMNAESSILVLLDERGGNWIQRKSLNLERQWVYQVARLEGSGILRQSLQEQRPIYINDASRQSQIDPLMDSIPGAQLGSLICLPLISQGQLVGALQVLNKPGGFSQFDQDMGMLVADLAANTIARIQLQRRSQISQAAMLADSWELANTRAILSSLLDNLPGSLYIIRANYELVALNAAAARYAGQDLERLAGQPCYKVLFQQPQPCRDCLVAHSFQSATNTQRSESRTSEGSWLTWEICSYPVFDAHGQVTQAILWERDITRNAELESIVAQSGKLAALGHMAAGMAHEINNPLTAILANAQILQRELPPGDQRQESVELISLAGAQVSQVVRNLLGYIRQDQPQRVLTDVNQTLRTSVALVRHQLLEGLILLDLALDENLPSILASPDNLQGVWLNLLLNAIESVDKQNRMIRVASRLEGEEIQISIDDNGRGIPPQILDRVFEPFYTTKGPGSGTGLGLSFCRGIIEQYNGRIQVSSRLGEGSQFTVILPFYASPPA